MNRNILIIEHHPFMGDAIEQFLKQQSQADFTFTITQENSMHRVIERLSNDPGAFDLIISDNNPVRDGSRLIRFVKKNMSRTPIMIFSSNTEQYVVHFCLEAGVKAYVLRSASKHDFFEAVLKVLQGQQYISPGLSIQLKRSFRKEEDPEQLKGLSKRQLDVLRNIDLPAKQIASTLGIKLATVHCHRYRLFKKLEVNNVMGLIKFAMKTGILKERNDRI